MKNILDANESLAVYLNLSIDELNARVANSLAILVEELAQLKPIYGYAVTHEGCQNSYWMTFSKDSPVEILSKVKDLDMEDDTQTAVQLNPNFIEDDRNNLIQEVLKSVPDLDKENNRDSSPSPGM